ncbi:uncharacterized protein LOC124132877 isoform X4 [Haliotis rufescens]|uniref:uncharacterized protein LOC124132877 isoform X3 n=1 Tax=Haliotis rufescens TaxID=6454 RepID=UPI001EAFDCC3|nr:uncharacterized protein LOC124132877 isoform X3 [Haliotis rufescens]XP_048254377.1 uncharacterized protein LOC124132877 isoform X4 [Haliotis rufescens]
MRNELQNPCLELETQNDINYTAINTNFCFIRSNDENTRRRDLSLVIQENDLYETSSGNNAYGVTVPTVDDAVSRRSALVMQENLIYEQSNAHEAVQIVDSDDVCTEVRKT